MHASILSSAGIISLLVVVQTLMACSVPDLFNRHKQTPKTTNLAAVVRSQCEFNELRIHRVIQYLNAYRSQHRSCGDTVYPHATALSWNKQLAAAALVHSKHMAQGNFLNHKDTMGLVPADRVSNAGYRWKTVAENIAGGTETPEQTIDLWMNSSGHCQNIMNTAHTQIGLACAENPASDYRIYWTLVLASPE